MSHRNFFAESERRNVYKVAVAYAVAAWLMVQAASILLPAFESPVLFFGQCRRLGHGLALQPEFPASNELVKSGNYFATGVVPLLIIAAVTGSRRYHALFAIFALITITLLLFAPNISIE